MRTAFVLARQRIQPRTTASFGALHGALSPRFPGRGERRGAMKLPGFCIDLHRSATRKAGFWPEASASRAATRVGVGACKCLWQKGFCPSRCPLSRGGEGSDGEYPRQIRTGQGKAFGSGGRHFSGGDRPSLQISAKGLRSTRGAVLDEIIPNEAAYGIVCSPMLSSPRAARSRIPGTGGTTSRRPPDVRLDRRGSAGRGGRRGLPALDCRRSGG